MTESIRNTRRFARRRSGFTLVEMLVVIGIILTLMAMLLPAINRAYRTATRSRMQADLQTLATALDAYRGAFDEYPQMGTGMTGAQLLARALVGPGDAAQDGYAGNGFRIRPQGKVYEPFISPDKIKLGEYNAAVQPGNPNNFVFMDKYRHPILYYPGKKGRNISLAGGYLGAQGMFNPDNNKGYWPNSDGTIFMRLMGDLNADGKIDTSAGESPAFQGDYVLWSPGPDEVYGPVTDPTQPVGPGNRCDDVANFPRSEY